MQLPFKHLNPTPFILILFISLPLPIITGGGFSKQQERPMMSFTFNVDSNNSHDQNTSVSQTSKLKNTSLQNQQINQVPYPDNSGEKRINWSEFLSHYKYHLIGATGVAVYGSLFALVLADDWYIRRKDTWGSWKQNIRLDEMQRYPSTQLMNELIHDIQRDHILNDPIDASASFTAFMSTIDYEINRIKRYLKISTFLQRTKLLLIFPTNAATIKIARTKLSRVQFIKQSFVSWAANYKIERHLKLAN